MFEIRAYHHVGIRVTDEARAVAFYKILGFEPEHGQRFPEHDAIGLINHSGVRLNLIYNGRSRPAGSNVLIDELEKWPGITHVAFEVPNLEAIMQQLNEYHIPITEGPLVVGKQRRICFIRDPDRNVIELNELLDVDHASTT